MLTIVVCVKQVHDPEAPVSLFQISPDGRKVIPPQGTPPVISPFDENALEAALRIKDVQEARIIAVSMGFKMAKPVMKKTLAAGADELILLEDERFEGLDSHGTAQVLARAIEKIGNCDIVLCGRQAADTDAGQVGPGIAEILQIPSITLACRIKAGGEKVRVERVIDNGFEIVESSTPVLITASNEIGELRTPSVKEFLIAQKKGITVWNTGDLDMKTKPIQRTTLHKLFTQKCERQGGCKMITGSSPGEIAERLADVLETRIDIKCGVKG